MGIEFRIHINVRIMPTTIRSLERVDIVVIIIIIAILGINQCFAQFKRAGVQLQIPPKIVDKY